jgi:hypothetical protein
MATKYQVVDDFKGYISKPDITNVGPGFLVKGSKNVSINTSSRLEFDKGYRLDGELSSVVAPITSSFDYDSKVNTDVNLRVGFRTTTNNGKMQYRYTYGATATWVDLLTGLSKDIWRFTTFWDEAELTRLCLMVNGDGSVYKWNGAVASVASNTATTLTKSGTRTWAEDGFNIIAEKSIVVNGVTYTYTGGENTLTLTGLTGLPTFTVGASVHQLPTSILTTTITNMPSNFKPDLIATLDNQVYYGMTANQNIWVSKFGDYKDCSFTTAGRKPTEGATARVDALLVGFEPQEESMIIHAGQNQIYETKFTLSADQLTEAFDVDRKKTGKKQAAKSQEFITKTINDSVFLTNEPTLQTYGRVSNNFAINQLTNISDSIENDMNELDFTGGQVFYNRQYIYITVPKSSLIYRYNLDTKAWQAPYYCPVTRLYSVGGELYGHSSGTSESYKLYEGGAARSTTDADGLPIEYVANFSYMNFGDRANQKTITEMYSEGYIDVSTDVSAISNFETNGCGSTVDFAIDGENKNYVCIPSGSNSFGKNSFGAEPVGGYVRDNLLNLPPKFRVFKVTPPVNFYEVQPQYYAFGVNMNFQLLAFGYDAVESKDKNIINKQ